MGNNIFSVKPCPFCNSTDLTIVTLQAKKIPRIYLHYVYCFKCATKGPQSQANEDAVDKGKIDSWGLNEAVRKWNSRSFSFCGDTITIKYFPNSDLE